MPAGRGGLDTALVVRNDAGMFGTRSRSGVTLRALAGSLVALLAVPSAGFAQDTKAGVVTTLEGNVTARRIALPSPVPLKVKDGVFFQDTVSTGDKALVRILLGGKAVVTIRELSVLTITEVPGQSTIDLESGKFGLAVAREKMRPGEAIRIRTPNAIAAVHGTVVVTEVSRKGAQLGGSAPAVTTKLYVLSGNIMAQQIDATTKQPIGTGVSIGALQAYSGAGSAPPQVTPIPPEQVSQVTSGLQPTGPKGGSDAAQEQVKAQAVETALALFGALTGTGPGTTMAAIVAPKPTIVQTPAPTLSTAPLIPPFAEALESQANQASAPEVNPLSGNLLVPAGTSLKTFTGTTVLTTTDPVLTLTGNSVTQLGTNDLISVGPGASLTMAGPMANVIDSVISTGGAFLGIDAASITSSTLLPFIAFDPVFVAAGASIVQIEQGTLNLAGSLFTDTGGTLTLGGSLLQINDASLATTGTAPLIDLSGTTVTSSGSFVDVSGLTQGSAPTSLSLAGPLLASTNSAITTGSDLLQIAEGASVSSTTLNPFMSLTSSSVTAAFNVFNLATNTSSAVISLAGSLVEATGTTFNAQDGSFLRMRDGVSLTQKGSSPLLKLTDVTGHSAANFMQLTSGAPASPQLSLEGQFLLAKNAVLTSGDPTKNTHSFVFIGDSATVTSSSPSAFLSLEGSTLDTAGNILTLARSKSVTSPSRLALAGPLLSATGSTLNHTSLGSASGCCNAFSIHQGAELISTTTSALIQLSNSTVIGADSQSGAAFFAVADTLAGAPASELVAPAKVLLAGPLVQATNSTITSLFDTISVAGSTLTNTTPFPLITLSGSTLSTGVVVAPSTPTNQILNIFASGASPAAMSLAGPVLSASASTINSNEIVQVLNLAKGAALTSTTSQPLVQLDGTTLTTRKARAVNTGFSVFSAAACPSGVCVGLNADGTFATMSLTGPLLSASNGSSVNTSASVVFVGPGGQLSVTGSTDPLMSLVGGTHAIASNLLDGFAPAMFDLRGRSTATGIETADGVALALGTDQPIKHSGGLLEASGATITSQRAFRLDTALLAASAPLVNLKPGSSLASSVDTLDLVQKAKLTSLGAVVKLDASSLTVQSGALALVRNGSLLTVAGDFLQLNGQLNKPSTLSLLNGPVLSVSGNSVVNISGALVNFGGTGGNLVSVANTLCSPSCTSIGGINVNLVGGASAANVTISNPVKNGSLGSINLSNSAQTAVISISGANSKVTISGN
jgi:hypothetical protein